MPNPTTPAIVILALAGLLVAALASRGEPIQDVAPAAQVWEAHASGMLIYPDGSAELAENPLVRAIEEIGWGLKDGILDVIEIHGDHLATGACPYISMGQSPYPGGNDASVVDGRVGGFIIRGVTSDARIGHVFIGERYSQVSAIKWQKLTVDAKGASYGFSFAMGDHFEDFVFEDVEVVADYCSKWGWRVHGTSVGFFWERCRARGFLEHGIYWDNAWDLTVRECIFENCGRTGVQCTNREDSGPSGGGLILIARNEFKECGIVDGGAAITIAGHLGTVMVRGNKVETTTTPDAYACVVWREGPKPSVGKIGAWRDESGYEISTLILGPRNKFEAPTTKRGVVGISACREVMICSNEYGESGKPDLQLDVPKYGGGSNGTVTFNGRGAPSSWPGWSGGVKVTIKSVPLTDQQIDAMVPTVRIER